MVRAQVAIFADSVRVVRSINMGALVSRFLAASRVIAVPAHAFCIKNLICVWARCDNVALAVLL